MECFCSFNRSIFPCFFTMKSDIDYNAIRKA